MFGLFKDASLQKAIVAGLALSTAVQAFPWPSHGDKKWVTIWGTMPQLTEPHNLPDAPFNETGVVFRDATLRQTVMVTYDADTIRLEISNTFGGSDLPITSATVALTADNLAGTSAINPSTLAKLTFSGSDSFIVPSGASVLSDPVKLRVKARDVVTVSMYLAEGQTTNLISGHPGSRTTSWFVSGDHVADKEFPADAYNVAHWYYINGIEGRVSDDSAALVIVGDSITDGRGSTTDQNDRWPDQLLQRMKKDRSTRGVSIVNKAAGGNRVLADGLGPNALGRIDRDVLAIPGAAYAIVYNGVNDIGTAGTDEASQTAVGDRLIEGYAQIVERLHRFDIPVFGVTITPLLGPGSPYDDVAFESTRQRVNNWIRESGKFDAVIDFDKVVRDPKNPEKLAAKYDVGDSLHLSPAGYKAMAEAVDLRLFKKFRNGV